MNAITKPTEKLGVMLCGHGSRDLGAVQEFAVVAGQLRAKLPFDAVEYGYLEFAKPIIRDGLDRLRAKGVTKVLAVPGMLFAAGHAKNDIPSVLNTYQAQNEGMTIDYGRELGIDPKMLRAAGDRIGRSAGIRQDRRSAPRDAACRRRPRRLRPRRQFQRRQGHAHAVGRHGLRLGRDRLFRRHLPAGRAGARARGEARLPPHRRVPLLPVHRHPGPAHLRRTPTRSRRSIPESSSSRPPTSTTTRWCSTPSSTG